MHMPSSRLRFAVLASILFAAGCAQVRVTPPPVEGGAVEPAVPGGPRFEPTPGQTAATIAELRAAPAPKQPEVSSGSSPSGDERVLNARGYVRVGTGYFPGSAPEARDWALRQGERIGADKALVYAEEGTPPSGAASRIGFYVRYRLPFGATFRSLNADEQRAIGSGGVQLGEIVGGTPASEANLQRGDFVIRFNGKAVADRPAFEQLLREHLGQRVTLTISRDGVTIERLVRLGVVAKAQGEAKK